MIAAPIVPAAVGPYSQGIQTGSLVFCSGQLPMDLSGKIPLTIAEQTHQSLKNVSAGSRGCWSEPEERGEDHGVSEKI